MKRGQLSKRIQELSNQFLKRDMTTTELRLIPYIQYLLVNNESISPSKLNRDDRDVLQQWREAGHFEGGMSGIGITKPFWDFMCEILFEGYVVYENREV